MTADTECAAAIGMLAKLYGLPVPQRQEELTQMRETLKQQIRDLSSTEQMDRLEQMLDDYEPKLAMDDEKHQLLCYTYEHTEK